MKETACAACGAVEPPGQYHPHAFCVLVKAIGSTSARAAINAVLDYGRKLERLGLPNDARIGTVWQAEDEAAKAKQRMQAAVKRPKQKKPARKKGTAVK